MRITTAAQRAKDMLLETKNAVPQIKFMKTVGKHTALPVVAYIIAGIMPKGTLLGTVVFASQRQWSKIPQSVNQMRVIMTAIQRREVPHCGALWR